MTDYQNVVPKAQGGDPKALDELYKSTSRAVYFTCRSLLKNEQDAEDLMQNTYITAFKKLKTLEQPEKFEPWIKRIAANLCKDFLVKKGAHPEQLLDEEGFDEPVDENFLPDEYIINAEKRSIVMKIMHEKLSDVLYQTVIMFYFDEMTVAEIAEEMNCPEGTVKYRLNAARTKIRQGVLDYEKKSGDKLYAFIGLPFLTRLLIEESKAASVPTLDIMSVVTQSTAVDLNFTANTITHAGGKMLGTLKAKIIAGAVAAAVVAGGGITAAVIIANNSADSGYISSTDSVPDSTSNTHNLPNDESDVSDSGAGISGSSNISDNISEPVPEDYEYVDIEGGIRIKKYNGNDEYLTVPAEIDGKKVLEIGSAIEDDFVFYSFDREVNINEITLPDGLTKIGDVTFAYLPKLKTVHIPDSVTSLGDGVFMECSSLENVILPEGLTELNFTFENCKSLSEITIPESVVVLFNTFEGCTSLTHITIPKNVEMIDYAFEDCVNLKEVIFLGTEIEEIGLGAFKNCTSLESIVIPDGVEEIVGSAFTGCTSLKSVTLPESLEEIESKAFEGCTSLKEITLPDGIRSVSPDAFEGCPDIKITFQGKVYRPNEISILLGSID